MRGPINIEVVALEQVNAELADLGAIPGFDKTRRFTGAFHLFRSLWATFEPTKGAHIEVVRQSGGDAPDAVRLTPRNMGAGQCYMLEIRLDPEELTGCFSIVAVLNAASKRGVALYAMVRVIDWSGRQTDLGAPQLDLSQTPRQHIFTVDLADLTEDVLLQAATAQLIFVFEAREVAVDLSSIQVLGLSVVSAPPPPPLQIEAKVVKTWVSSLRAADLGSARALAHDVPLSSGCLLNYDPDGGHTVSLRRDGELAVFDFSQASESRWRTIEFRFTLENSSRFRTLLGLARAKPLVSAPLAAEIYLEASAPGTQVAIQLPMLLRIYDEKGRPVADHPRLTALTLDDELAPETVKVDLPLKRSDAHETSVFGLLFSVPPDCAELALRVFTVTIGPSQVRTQPEPNRS